MRRLRECAFYSSSEYDSPAFFRGLLLDCEASTSFTMSSLDPGNAANFFDRMLKQSKVVIVSATYCTFCTKIKMLLIELKVRFVSLEIDIIPNGREVFRVASDRTNVNTVPQIFFNGK